MRDHESIAVWRSPRIAGLLALVEQRADLRLRVVGGGRRARRAEVELARGAELHLAGGLVEGELRTRTGRRRRRDGRDRRRHRRRRPDFRLRRRGGAAAAIAGGAGAAARRCGSGLERPVRLELERRRGLRRYAGRLQPLRQRFEPGVRRVGGERHLHEAGRLGEHAGGQRVLGARQVRLDLAGGAGMRTALERDRRAPPGVRAARAGSPGRARRPPGNRASRWRRGRA